MKMKLKDGKSKVLTLSYDDGVVQDIRLIEILNRYGLKGTFNLNSGLYVSENTIRKQFRGRLKLSEAKALYTDSGHEIALHTFTHPSLKDLDFAEMIYEITEDKKYAENQYERIVEGMAYPFGTYSEQVMDILKKCHVRYARTANSTYQFGFPENWLLLHPTCHHKDEKLGELIRKFVETADRQGNAEMFYLWGHSYEFDEDDNWELIESFAEYAGGHEHIWYATNIEIYNYVKAYESLQSSFDKKLIHNPTDIDVWLEWKGGICCVKSGETLKLN